MSLREELAAIKAADEANERAGKPTWLQRLGVSEDPAIGTLELIMGLDQCLKIWRESQRVRRTRPANKLEEAVGVLLARWLLKGGESPAWRDADERYRFAAWCEVRGIAKASRLGKVLRRKG
jgi:hypothetical protein